MLPRDDEPPELISLKASKKIVNRLELARVAALTADLLRQRRLALLPNHGKVHCRVYRAIDLRIDLFFR